MDIRVPLLVHTSLSISRIFSQTVCPTLSTQVRNSWSLCLLLLPTERHQGRVTRFIFMVWVTSFSFSHYDSILNSVHVYYRTQDQEFRRLNDQNTTRTYLNLGTDESDSDAPQETRRPFRDYLCVSSEGPQRWRPVLVLGPGASTSQRPH